MSRADRGNTADDGQPLHEGHLGPEGREGAHQPSDPVKRYLYMERPYLQLLPHTDPAQASLDIYCTQKR